MTKIALMQNFYLSLKKNPTPLTKATFIDLERHIFIDNVVQQYNVNVD